MNLPARLICLAILCTGSALADTGGKMTLGWIETIQLDRRLNLELEAKLDTGADTSSLDARDIRRVRAGERRYVRFTVRDPESGERVELRKPYVRRVRIKRHDGNYQRRYVVRMQVCIGDHKQSIDVSLIDREAFDYPMLLGRSALEGWTLIDPAAENTTHPTCWVKPTVEPTPADWTEPDQDIAGSDDPNKSGETRSVDGEAKPETGAEAIAGTEAEAMPAAGVEAIAGTEAEAMPAADDDAISEADAEAKLEGDAKAMAEAAAEAMLDADAEEIADADAEALVEVEAETMPAADDEVLPEADGDVMVGDAAEAMPEADDSDDIAPGQPVD